MTGFEPAAPASQKQCSTKLSYIPLLTEVIITLLVPLVKWFPVLPSIMMHCPHSQNRNKHKKKSHDSQTPWGVHYMTNKKLNVCHCGYALLRPHTINEAIEPNIRNVETNVSFFILCFISQNLC